jgi:hypothetical protein
MVKYKPSVIRAIDDNDLLALILNLKGIRDRMMKSLDELNADIKMLEPILKEKMERSKKGI